MRNGIEMRFLALALAAAMTVAALSGCGKGGQSGKENTQAQTEQELVVVGALLTHLYLPLFRQ